MIEFITSYEAGAEYPRPRFTVEDFDRFAESIRTYQQPRIRYSTSPRIRVDDVRDPDSHVWPSECEAIGPKPQTEEGIKLFYDRHPELRGIM